MAGLAHTFTTVQDAMEQFGGALRGLSEGKLQYGRGLTALNKMSAKLLDPSESAAEGAVPGKLGSFAQAGVYMGALSLGTGTADQASHRAIQNSRVLNPDATNAKGRAALKLAGVDESMDDPQKLIQLAHFFKASKITNPGDWLAARGLGTTATREGMVASLKVADVLESRLAGARESAKTNATGAATIAANETFARTDKSATAAALASKLAVMDQATGILGSEEYEKAKQAAELRMRQQDPSYFGVMRGVHQWIGSPASYLLAGVGGKGLQQETDPAHGAQAVLREGRGRVGLDVDKAFPNLQAGSYQLRAESFTRAAAAVRARGGDPLDMQGLDAGVRRELGRIQRPESLPEATGGGPAGGGEATLPVLKAMLTELKAANTKPAGPAGRVNDRPPMTPLQPIAGGQAVAP